MKFFEIFGRVKALTEHNTEDRGKRIDWKGAEKK